MDRGTTDDRTAIHELHEQFAEAWTGGDVAGLVDLFAEDARRVGVRGDVQQGRDAIRAAFEQLLTGPLAGASVRLERGSVRFLGDDVALWQGAIEILPAGGRPGIGGYAVDVMKKVGSTWVILETHPKLFPPPPANPR